MCRRTVLFAFTLLCLYTADASAIPMRVSSNRASTNTEAVEHFSERANSVSDIWDSASNCREISEIGCRTTIRGVTRVNFRPIYNGEPMPALLNEHSPTWGELNILPGRIKLRESPARPPRRD